MKRSKKVAIIAACLFLIILIGGSIYAYDRIIHILTASNLQQLIRNDNQDKLSTFSSPKAPESKQIVTIPESTDEQQDNTEASGAGENKQAQADTKQEKPSQPSVSSPAANPTIDSKIASTLEKEAGRPIDTSDIVKAGIILMSKLSNDEINFLMGFSDKKYTSDELKDLRKLLLSKLNAQDVETLRGLADKYGKNLYILDPNVPIK